MSWEQQIALPFVITTGDGTRYEPLYESAVTMDYEWNIAYFDFPDIDGTLVKRSARKGAKYDLSLYFQGEDNIDQAIAFAASSLDRRPWTVQHPIWGRLLVQPASLKFENLPNVTKITGTITETISEDYPLTDADPVNKSQADVELYNEVSAVNFAGTVTPDVADINQLAATNKECYEAGSVLATGEQANEYFNLFGAANQAIIGATSDPFLAMTSLKTMLMYPSQFTASVQSRYGLLNNQLQDLLRTAAGLLDPSSKKILETTGGTLIAAMGISLVTPLEGDYLTSVSVLNMVTAYIGVFNQFMGNLDLLQTPNGGEVNSYIPNAAGISGLQDSVLYICSQLFVIAMNAQQERIIFLPEDSNALVLSHRFYGSDPSDKALDRFISTNNIGSNELLGLKKGRKIIYYV